MLDWFAPPAYKVKTDLKTERETEMKLDLKSAKSRLQMAEQYYAEGKYAAARELVSPALTDGELQERSRQAYFTLRRLCKIAVREKWSAPTE